jgi:acyl-CoA thioesterase
MTIRDQKNAETVTRLKTAAVNEPIAKFLGMKLAKLTPGYAKVTMKVKPEHLNFNGLVFGGVIAAIADQAFAYGSNSIHYPSVAVQFNLNLIAAASSGDKLTAKCHVIRSGRRAGISEITVTNQDDKLIAKATGVTVPVGE